MGDSNDTIRRIHFNPPSPWGEGRIKLAAFLTIRKISIHPPWGGGTQRGKALNKI